MLCLAYTHKHGKVGLLVYDDRRQTGQLIAYMAPLPNEHAALFGEYDEQSREIAKHAARAWDIWTKGADPDKSAIVLAIDPLNAEIKITIAQRTPELDAEISVHAHKVSEALERAKKVLSEAGAKAAKGRN